MKVDLTEDELKIIQMGLDVGIFECQIPENDTVVKGLIEKLKLDKTQFPAYFPEEYARDDVSFRAHERLLQWGSKFHENPHKEIVDTYNKLKILPRGYKVTMDDSWSCVFASVVAIDARCEEIVPMECSCLHQMQLFKQRGQWKQSEYIPKPGDYVYYDWNQDDCPEHVGIVVEVVSDNCIITIEGNVNGKVCKRTMFTHNSGSYILGYGVPDYGKRGESDVK